MNKLVKNPRHIAAITSPSKPNVYSSASQASSLAFVMQIILAFLTTCNANGCFDGRVIAITCLRFLINLFTKVTVYACNMFTQL